MFFVDFLCSYKKDLFPGHFMYKLENKEVQRSISKFLKRTEAKKVVEKT